MPNKALQLWRDHSALRSVLRRNSPTEDWIAEVDDILETHDLTFHPDNPEARSFYLELADHEIKALQKELSGDGNRYDGRCRLPQQGECDVRRRRQ